QPLRVLILEDREANARPSMNELRLAGFEPDWKRAETKKDFLSQLDPAPNTVFSDYRLSQWDASHALRLLRQRGLDLPLIVGSNAASEDHAAKAQTQGAADYLLKDGMARLGRAVRWVVREREADRANRPSEQWLRLQASALEAADGRPT